MARTEESMTAETLGMIIGVYALLMVISSIDLILTFVGFKA
jgi:hypothetical protein